MASHRCLTIIVAYCFVVSCVASTVLSSSSSLSPDFYEHTCPRALQAIQTVVRAAVSRERRMGASLLRLHFHDCFVNVNILPNFYTHTHTHTFFNNFLACTFTHTHTHTQTFNLDTHYTCLLIDIRCSLQCMYCLKNNGK